MEDRKKTNEVEECKHNKNADDETSKCKEPNAVKNNKVVLLADDDDDNEESWEPLVIHKTSTISLPGKVSKFAENHANGDSVPLAVKNDEAAAAADDDDDNEESWEPLVVHKASLSPISSSEDSIPFAYLAALSREVYGLCDEEGNNIITDTADLLQPESSSPKSDIIISVGADRFSYCIHHKTLFVSICGTFHPAQQIMNVMPHLATGVNVARQVLGHNDSTRSIPNAYDNGFQKGWMDPASRIYDELLKRLDDDQKKDLNQLDLFDTIYLTGHSRGGLLALYVGWNFVTQGNYHPGTIHVVGFGMPPPLRNPSYEESEFIKRTVISVMNRNDPVANESYIKCLGDWYPTKIIVGKEKIKPEPVVPANPEPSGSMWSLVGSIIKTAASAVGDTISEIREDIEIYHPIAEYEREILEYQSNRGITTSYDAKWITTSSDLVSS